MTTKHWILFTSLVLTTLSATAAESTCKAKQLMPYLLKSVTWDESKKIATVESPYDGTLKGEITSIRKHNGGKKINIVVKHNPPARGAEMTEFAIYPVAEKFYVIGATYIHDGDRRDLQTASDNEELECIIR